MNIYTNEIQDGIADSILAQNSVACFSDIMPLSEKLEHGKKVYASEALPEQPDLFCFRSVHVSTGWNLNDDIFLKNEILRAFGTPSHKQLNIMHNEKEIVGHMVSAFLANFDNQIISLEEAAKFKDLNVIVDSVFYRAWSDIELQEKYNKIIDEINENKWSVSMECIFTDFDYALKDSSNNIKIISRDEKTSYLSKFLRSYGGTGVYLNYKIGRILRNFVFSGQGLVDRPANPRSVILQKTVAGDKNDMDEIMKELEATKAELATVKSELASAKEMVETLTQFKTKSEELETSVASTNEKVTTLEAQVAELSTTLAQVTTERDAAVASYKEVEKKMKSEKRKAALAEFELGDEEFASFESLDDESFDKIVAVMKKKAVKKEEKEEEKKEETKAVELVVEPEKSQASLNDISNSSNGKTVREKIAEHLSANVFKTVRSK